MRTLPAWIASIPAMALALASLWMTAAAAGGGGLWPADDVTLSEAVATRNAAETSRLIGLGADPNRATRVRPELLIGQAVTVTPLEAAVWVRDQYLMTVLLESGALPDPEHVRVLRCLNDAEPDAHVRAVLQALSDTPWPACDTVTLPGPAGQ